MALAAAAAVAAEFAAVCMSVSIVPAAKARRMMLAAVRDSTN